MAVETDNERPISFKFNILIFTEQTLGLEIAKNLQQNLPKIGIEAVIDIWDYDSYYARDGDFLLAPAVHGGYDMKIVTLPFESPLVHPNRMLQMTYGADSIPPDGFNLMLWSSAKPEYLTSRADESNHYIEQMNKELDLFNSRTLSQEWQLLWYDVMPNIVVYYPYETHVISEGLFGYDPIKYVLESQGNDLKVNPLGSIETIKLFYQYPGLQDNVVFGMSSFPRYLIDPLRTDIYGSIAISPIFDSLVGLTPSDELVLPTGTDRRQWMEENYHEIFDTTDYLEIYPRVAKKLGNFSEDGRQYTIQLRDDVYFHDGQKVDAWDIAFSFQLHLNPEIKSLSYSQRLEGFGIDNNRNNHGNYSFIPKDLNEDGFYETITFVFTKKWPNFLTDYLGSVIFPEHILGDPLNHGFTNFDEIVYKTNYNYSDFNFDPKKNWQVTPTDMYKHSFFTLNTFDSVCIWCSINSNYGGSNLSKERKNDSPKTILLCLTRTDSNHSRKDFGLTRKITHSR